MINEATPRNQLKLLKTILKYFLGVLLFKICICREIIL